MDGPNLLAINVGARHGRGGRGDPVEATEAFAARLGTMTVVMENGERELARAPGTALLGHPLNVLPWLAQDLASRGQRLRAGDLVSLGGFSPALPTRRAAPTPCATKACWPRR
jgi:2-keto-4-pentenoate hydratase